MLGSRRRYWIAGGLAVLWGGLTSIEAGPAADQGLASEQALVKQYCATCHSPQSKTGGIVLDPAEMADLGSHAAKFEKVVRMLRAGMMPPAGIPRPPKPAYDGLAKWFEDGLDRAAVGHVNVGRTEALHRLNRNEYENAIRDLLGLRVHAAELLPADDGSYGFDNIAGVLKISPTLMERYLAAARTVSRLAMGDPPKQPEAVTFRLPPGLPQYEHREGLPFGTRGGARIDYNFPCSGEYEVKVELQRASGGAISGVFEQHQMEVSLDGEQLRLFTIEPDAKSEGSEEKAGAAPATSKKDLDADLHLRVAVKAGPRSVEVAFLMKDDAEVTDVRKPFRRLDNAGGNGVALTQPHVAAVVITGPYGSGGHSPDFDTPSRRKIFVCRPESAAQEESCATKILTNLARNAYRRPVSSEDVQPLLATYMEGRTTSNFDSGIERALRRLLVSPEFLFRFEFDPAGVAAGTNYRIPDSELASRLSFFLWSSIPDDELLTLAAENKLHTPAVLDRQVRRMMADDRFDALVSNFVAQWLYLRNLPAVTPNLDMFPDFDEGLRQDMGQETELFVSSIMREDRSAIDLLRADYTFLNERLAKHYEIPNVYGSEFRKVKLGDQAAIRGGLLGQASILTVTSHADRTSPILRGKWVLENILGTPPPPPPANVPALKENRSASGKILTMREVIAEHRSKQPCAGCHAFIDPAGFALERFNAVGQLREVDDTRPVPWVRVEGGPAIDASGMLPDGSKFDGPAELKQVLLDRSELFVKNITEKLMIYALGRGLEYYDMPTVRRIVHESAASDYRFPTLIMGVVHSQPFQMRRSQ